MSLCYEIHCLIILKFQVQFSILFFFSILLAAPFHTNQIEYFGGNDFVRHTIYDYIYIGNDVILLWNGVTKIMQILNLKRIRNPSMELLSEHASEI